MSKRKINDAPMEQTCPACHENFDSARRVPFVVSCGHSICAVCTNEKKTNPCPVCNKRRGFQNQEFNPDDFACSSKDPESASSAVLQHISFLPQIINHLDPASFVTFARTCKAIHHLCFHSQEIKVTYDFNTLVIGRMSQWLRFLAEEERIEDYVSDPDAGKESFLASKEQKKNLVNYPFVFKLPKLILFGRNIDRKGLARIRSILDISIKTIPEINVVNKGSEIVDWEGFIQFLKDFRTTDVLLRADVDDQNASWIQNHAATALLQNTDRFRTDFCVSDEPILNATVRRLHIKNALITQETFVKLLQRFANSTEEIKWRLGSEFFQFWHYDLFKTVDFYHNETFHGPLPEERPLVFANEDLRREFHILRRDGKELRCFLYRDDVVLSTYSDLGEEDDEPDNC